MNWTLVSSHLITASTNTINIGIEKGSASLVLRQYNSWVNVPSSLINGKYISTFFSKSLMGAAEVCGG